MRFMPERDEVLALVGVWLLWPSLYLFRNAITAMLSGFSGSLPLTTRLGIEVLQWNRWCLPSLAGTAIVVGVARVITHGESRKTAYHAVTLAAFGFAVGVLGLLFLQ